MWQYGNVPPAIAKAFEDKATISAPELSRVIPMDLKTLKRHCCEGHITYVLTGFGDRKRFTLEAVMRFLSERSRTAIPPTGLPLRATPAAPSVAPGSLAALREQLRSERLKCGFRRKPATSSETKPASVPI